MHTSIVLPVVLRELWCSNHPTFLELTYRGANLTYSYMYVHLESSETTKIAHHLLAP